MDAVRRRIRGGLQAFGLAVETATKRGAPVRTGNHRRSVHMEYSEQGEVFAVKVTHYSDYGGYLELGTSKMPARPHFRPAFEAEKPRLARLLAEGGSNA